MVWNCGHFLEIYKKYFVYDLHLIYSLFREKSYCIQLFLSNGIKISFGKSWGETDNFSALPCDLHYYLPLLAPHKINILQKKNISNFLRYLVTVYKLWPFDTGVKIEK